MAQKTIWIDTETTGLPGNNAAIIEIAILVEDDIGIVDRLNLFLKPHEDAGISEKALEVNGITLNESIKRGIYPKEAHTKITALLDKHCDKFNTMDKLIVGGYKTSFDIDMLKEFFERNNNKFLFSYIHATQLDVMSMVALARHLGVVEENALQKNRLIDVTQYFGINITKEHSAIADITATRELFYTIYEKILDDRR